MHPLYLPRRRCSFLFDCQLTCLIFDIPFPLILSTEHRHSPHPYQLNSSRLSLTRHRPYITNHPPALQARSGCSTSAQHTHLHIGCFFFYFFSFLFILFCFLSSLTQYLFFPLPPNTKHHQYTRSSHHTTPRSPPCRCALPCRSSYCVSSSHSAILDESRKKILHVCTSLSCSLLLASLFLSQHPCRCPTVASLLPLLLYFCRLATIYPPPTLLSLSLPSSPLHC